MKNLILMSAICFLNMTILSGTALAQELFEYDTSYLPKITGYVQNYSDGGESVLKVLEPGQTISIKLNVTQNIFNISRYKLRYQVNAQSESSAAADATFRESANGGIEQAHVDIANSIRQGSSLPTPTCDVSGTVRPDGRAFREVRLTPGSRRFDVISGDAYFRLQQLRLCAVRQAKSLRDQVPVSAPQMIYSTSNTAGDFSGNSEGQHFSSTLGGESFMSGDSSCGITANPMSPGFTIGDMGRYGDNSCRLALNSEVFVNIKNNGNERVKVKVYIVETN